MTRNSLTSCASTATGRAKTPPTAPTASTAMTTMESTTFCRMTPQVRRLKPMDRQLMLLYLEGVDAASIGEVTGLSASNVATKIHRIKAVLARRFHDGRAQ